MPRKKGGPRRINIRKGDRYEFKDSGDKATIIQVDATKVVIEVESVHPETNGMQVSMTRYYFTTKTRKI